MEKFGKEAREILGQLGGKDAPDGETRPQTTQDTELRTNRESGRLHMQVGRLHQSMQIKMRSHPI